MILAMEKLSVRDGGDGFLSGSEYKLVDTSDAMVEQWNLKQKKMN